MRPPSLPWRGPESLKAFLLEHLLDAPERLPGSFFVLYQGKAHVLISVLTKADTRTHRNLCLGEERFRKFERAHGFVSIGYRCPDEHRRLRHGYWPTQLIQALDQDIAPLAVVIAYLLNAL